MQKFEVKGHEASLLPDGEWRLVWNDEFDGTELDRTKWDYRMSMMGKEWQAWTDEGVHLDGNSNAVFTLMMKNGRPVSSQLQTGYTYFVDGKEDGKITDFTSHRRNFILISTEVKGYRYEDHQPVKEAFDNIGDTFVVDHVRVFEREN